MTIQVERMPGGLISVKCGNERVYIDPFDVTPPVTGSGTSPTKSEGGGYGSPATGPTVTFRIADPLLIEDLNDIMWVSRPNSIRIQDLIAGIGTGQKRSIVNLRLAEESNFPLAALTDAAEGADIDFRLWVPRGKGIK